ncbi:MAG: GSCFA domain-containing protein, partial [Bacteroidales bacterium]|nr:GSCFA domain-containing protein [Bacteroidales bacterium]
MMRFRTEVTPEPLNRLIDYRHNLMFIGSCFTEHIGNKMYALKFKTDMNPFGIVYNPASIAIQLQRLLKAEPYHAKDLFQHDDLWHSFDFHSRFSHIDRDVCLELINRQLTSSAEFLRKTDFLFITFGTAVTFHLADSGEVVSNCHKLPADRFETELLRVGEIVHAFQRVLGDCRKINNDLQVILSVSPVRYLKEGPLGNQVSKATLLLACSELSERMEYVHYFPAYEVFMDDLRDYRFYDSDLVHPSKSGIDYIWKLFQNSCLDPHAGEVIREVEAVVKAARHKHTGQVTPKHQKFLEKYLVLTKSLQS